MERLRRYIAEEQLDVRNRKREIVYTRFYLAAWYKDQRPNATLLKIGEYFNNGHDWTIHALREYEKYKDDGMFVEYTEDVRRAFPMGVEDLGTSQCLTMFSILSKQNQRIVVN